VADFVSETAFVALEDARHAARRIVIAAVECDCGRAHNVNLSDLGIEADMQPRSLVTLGDTLGGEQI
jgi:hypothetical protein